MTETSLAGRIHDLQIFRPLHAETDSLLLSFRHGHVAALVFDHASSSMKTYSVHSVGACNGEERISKLRVCTRTSSMAALQVSVDTLSMVIIVDGSLTTSFGLSVTEQLRLNCLDDFCFLTSRIYGPSEVVLAVLGQVKAHASLGRMGSSRRGSALKILSVSSSDKKGTPVTLWTVDDLPHTSFRLCEAPGGLLTISPDAIVYSAAFGVSWAQRVNEAENELPTPAEVGACKLMPVRRELTFASDADAPEIPINLDGCAVAWVASTVVTFALADGSLYACSLVLDSKSTVTSFIWKRLASTPPSQLCTSKGPLVFLGSRLGSSTLLTLSDASVTIPTSLRSRVVNFTESTPATVSSDGLVATTPDEAELLDMYGDLMREADVLPSATATIIDTLESFGLVRHSALLGDRVILSCGGSGSGALACLKTTFPTDELFACNLPKSMQESTAAEVFTVDGRKLLMTSSVNTRTTLLLDVTSSIKAIATLAISFFAAAAIGQIATLVTPEGLVQVDMTSGVTMQLTQGHLSQGSICHVPWTDSLVAATLSVEGAVAVYQISGSSPVEANLPEMESATCVGVSCIDRLNDVWLTIVSTVGGCLVVRSLSDGAEIFRAPFVTVLPAILGQADDFAASRASLSISDASAPPVEPHPAVGVFAEQTRAFSVCAEWLHAEDEGPTFFLTMQHRPLAIYRPFQSTTGSARFPWGFKLVRHTGSVTQATRPRRFEHGWVVGQLACIVCPRGQLRLHRLDGGGIWLPVSTDFCPSGFLAVNGRELSVQGISQFESTLAEDGETLVSLSYDFTAASPVAIVKQVGFFPLMTAPSPSGIAVALASTEWDLSAEVVLPQQVVDSVGEDGEDGVEAAAAAAASAAEVAAAAGDCAVVRTRLRFELRVIKPADLKTVLGSVTLQPDEQVTGLGWLTEDEGSLLVVGTSFQLAEDAPGKGRIVVYKVKGGLLEQVYESEKKTGVSTLTTKDGMVVSAQGYKLMWYRWEASSKSLIGCAMYDVALHTTCVGFAKNYVAAGDLLRGVQLLQFKEEDKDSRSVMLLAKTSPFVNITIVSVECLRNGNSMSVLAVDDRGNLHLISYEVALVLRQSTPMLLNSVVRNLTGVGSADGTAKSVLAALTNGSVQEVMLVDPQDFHMAASLASLMISLVAYPAGLNPRLSHSPLGPQYKKEINAMLLSGGHAIETGKIARDFLFLSTPLQAEIAERLQQSIDGLGESISKWTQSRLAPNKD